MIGLVVDPKDLDVAEEFFQLFKTPWELAVKGRKYHVILSTDGFSPDFDAKVFLVYGSARQAVDEEAGFAADLANGPLDVEWSGSTFPVYKGVALFESHPGKQPLMAGGKPIHLLYCIESRSVRRIGYDLFDEIRYLLTKGQPAARALTPTMDFHINVLRHLLIESQIPFVEIPPRPHGYDVICCLTHDVDFFGIRRHRFDRTMAGFLYRSSIGSVTDFIRGRRSLGEAARNWSAFLCLPLVLLGVLPDLWRPFEDYAKVEDGRKSTFFLVPVKGNPGVSPDGRPNAWRATPYGLDDVQEEVKAAASRGSELGVHGIDAWRDADAGREEMGRLTSITGQKTVGIRMHWLYFDVGSPRKLEEAGYDYDSTCGYNDAVGYRAGTSQVFRPLGSEALMELPMTIMDSALFSSGRMGLSSRQGWELCRRILENARHFAGTLVINWHERSLAPERLWGRFYRELLEEIGRETHAWLATAGEAVEWFRWRRSITFRESQGADGAITIRVMAPCSYHVGGIIRTYRPGQSEGEIRDVLFDGICPADIQV